VIVTVQVRPCRSRTRAASKGLVAFARTRRS
jgi:hypothetical protein